MGWIIFLFGFLDKAEGDNVIISNNQKIIVLRFQKKNIDRRRLSSTSLYRHQYALHATKLRANVFLDLSGLRRKNAALLVDFVRVPIELKGHVIG